MSGLITVIGMPSGGTSCTAGILARLGVDMGRLLKPDQQVNAATECIDWKAVCDKWCPLEPIAQTVPWGMEVDVLPQLSNYVATRLGAPGRVGCKSPWAQLLLVQDFCAPVIDAKMDLVHVRRPLEDSIVSWRKKHRQHGWRDIGKKWGWLWACKHVLFERHKPAFAFDFYDLVTYPHATIMELIDALKLNPTETQIVEAVDFVSRERVSTGPIA